MKHSTFIAATLIAGSMLMGTIGQASAMVVSGSHTLESGSSVSRLVDGASHYRIQVDSPTRLSVQSEVWNPQVPTTLSCAVCCEMVSATSW